MKVAFALGALAVTACTEVSTPRFTEPVQLGGVSVPQRCSTRGAATTLITAVPVTAPRGMDEGPSAISNNHAPAIFAWASSSLDRFRREASPPMKISHALFSEALQVRPCCRGMCRTTNSVLLCNS